VVQQGTIASNSAPDSSVANATILPASPNIVYTGIVSWAASKPVSLYVLHSYGISSTQTAINSTFGQLQIISINGQLYAVQALSGNAGGQSASGSGSTVFSGNGLMLVSNAGPFLAAYSLKATADTPTIVNDFSSAIPTTP
jgi:hypothetical protein